MIRDLELTAILNSRGEETVRVTVVTEEGRFSSDCPCGKSRGSAEPVFLPVSRISGFFPEFKKNLIGFDETDFESVDSFLEEFGGERFSKIGGNLSIAVSQAVLKAAAGGDVYRFLGGRRVFPYPLGNVIGGGVHGGYTEIQEFLVVPFGSETLPEAVRTNVEIWNAVRTYLEARGIPWGRNDEGAITFKAGYRKILEILCSVAEDYGAGVGVDMAASTVFENGEYRYPSSGKVLDPGEQLEFVRDLVRTFNLVYVEDPFHEEDFSSFAELTRSVKCVVCGDDLFVTNPERLEIGLNLKSANGIILKPTQAGTVSRLFKTENLARKKGMIRVVSHRSGETCDPFISDLAVGTGSELVKCGIMGGERVSKANRLLEIWERESERGRVRMVRVR